MGLFGGGVIGLLGGGVMGLFGGGSIGAGSMGSPGGGGMAKRNGWYSLCSGSGKRAPLVCASTSCPKMEIQTAIALQSTMAAGNPKSFLLSFLIVTFVSLSFFVLFYCLSSILESSLTSYLFGKAAQGFTLWPHRQNEPSQVDKMEVRKTSLL